MCVCACVCVFQLFVCACMCNTPTVSKGMYMAVYACVKYLSPSESVLEVIPSAFFSSVLQKNLHVIKESLGQLLFKSSDSVFGGYVAHFVDGCYKERIALFSCAGS